MQRRTSRRRFVITVLGAAGGAHDISAQQSGGIRGFDHVAVPMRNTDAMIAFYRAFGLQMNETANAVSVYVGGGQMINFHRPSLWQDLKFTLRAAGAKPPSGDFCFVWEGTADALKTTLDRAGAKIEVGPVDRAGGRRKNGSSVYVRDPDGNLLEFMIYS